MFGFLFTLIVGIGVGYIFKPQLDQVLLPLFKRLRDGRDDH